MHESDPSTRSRNTSVILILLCTFFQVIPVGAVALFLPRIREQLGLTFTEAGSLTAAVMLVYGVMQIPAGYLADKLNPRWMFFIGAAGTSALLLIFGLVQQYWQAVTAQSLLGFFNSLVFLPGAILMMRLFQSRRRASAMSVLLLGLYAGQIVLNLFGPVLAPGTTWRPVFIYFGAVGVAVSLFYLRFSRDQPRATNAPRIVFQDIVRVLKSKFMWLCNGMQFVRLAIYFGVTSWIPAYLQSEKGLSLQITGLIVVGQFVVIACGTMLGGFLSDKLRRPAMVVAVSYTLLLITLLLLTIVHDISGIIVVLMINSLCLASTSGSLYSMPIERLGANAAGTITGVGNMCANLGAFAFTYLLGSLKDATGLFQTGFYAMAIACAAGLIFTMLAGVSRHNYLGSHNAS
jgi:sugar phosphate permease